MRWPTKTTSSTKPEEHNISQRRQKRTEPRPQTTCTKKIFAKCSSVVLGTWLSCKYANVHVRRPTRNYVQTDRQTDRHPHHNSLYFTRFAPLLMANGEVLAYFNFTVAWRDIRDLDHIDRRKCYQQSTDNCRHAASHRSSNYVYHAMV